MICHPNVRIVFFNFGGQNGTDTIIDNLSIAKGTEATSLKYYFKYALILVNFS